MKTITKHLSEIILAIVAIMLVVGIVLCFATPIGGFFTNVINKESAAANGVWNYGSYDGTGSGGGGGSGGANSLEPGLYDANDVLLASWDELTTTYGMDAEISYTLGSNNNYETTPSSPYYVLTNNSELASGVKLVIGDVEKIGALAFNAWESLTNVIIPDSVTSIGAYAFQTCQNLESITIPDSVTSIGSYAFYDCPSLTNITIPNDVTTINDMMFGGCMNLKSVTISNKVTKINMGAFYLCKNLNSINFEGTVAQWTAITKGSGWKMDSSLTTVTCSDGTVTLS